jgi:undecaprenyl phosphate-alpha-L-ara4FN deformylase
LTATVQSRPLLVLKIDVDTYRGTREGVPNLVRMLTRHAAGATFLFSLGPDHTGWAMRRALRPGFFQKVSRTSVLEHYGFKTLMYGVLLPGPDIGAKEAREMRAARDAGFECGIHTWDHVLWQDNVRKRDAAWTDRMMKKSEQRYAQVFGEAPRTHGAAGWQMNVHAFARHDAAGYGYASDGRACCATTAPWPTRRPHPYRFIAAMRRTSRCRPRCRPWTSCWGATSTAPCITTANIAAHLLKLTAENRRDHVYTLHAELEGQKLAPIFEQLLSGWKAQGYQLASMADYHEKIKHLAAGIRISGANCRDGRAN